MKAWFCLVPFTLFALAHCGSEDPAPGAGGKDTTTQAGSGPPRSCRPTCTTAADCGTPGQPLQDSSHFACEAGRCEWLGCLSASECSSILQTPDVTCAAAPGDPVPVCVDTCQTAADCAVSGSTLSDAAHFACTGGKCQWTGCKSTTECQAALGSNRYACEKPAGANTPMCVPTCQTAADCAIPGSPLNDQSHYACKANRCEWLGCKSTAECKSALSVSKVVCE